MAWITSCDTACVVIMDARIAMAHHADTESLRALQNEIESFIQSLAHPVAVEDEVELFDLASASWKLSIQFDKLLFEAWNSSRTLARGMSSRLQRAACQTGCSTSNWPRPSRIVLPRLQPPRGERATE